MGESSARNVDGWERGDPCPPGEAVARLSRLAYRLVWVNPHASRDGHQPLTGGMAVALENLVRVISHA
jgi:uncharacterized protein with von Willebrand factor type A (vWA) domain